MSFYSFKILLLVQEELWAAIEAEVLDATGEVYIAGEDAEALHGAYVAKVYDYLVWQWLNILAPSRVPVGFFVTVNHIIGNTFAKCLGIGIYNVPLVLVDDVATLVNKFNFTDARVLVVVRCLYIDAQMAQCLYD